MLFMTAHNIVWPFATITPREVQLEALAKGYGKPGFAYFMRQRTGKTWVAYAEFALLRDQGLCDWFLVICPNNLKQQWADAIKQADPSERCCIYISNEKEKIDKFFRGRKTGVFIINYESLVTFRRRECPFDLSRTYVVADESTKIKEWRNKSTKAAVALASQGQYRRILTGRPTANNNMDIWAQLKFIGCATRNYYSHRATFCVLGGFQGRQVVKSINTQQLKEEIDPISYVAPDKFVDGFIKIYEPLRRVELSGVLLKHYKQMEDDLVTALNEDVSITAPIILTKYLRLQQISSGIVGDDEGNQHNLVEPSHNQRIAEVVGLCENECTNKTIIVTRFRKSLDNLFEVLVAKGYKVAKLNGGMEGVAIEAEKKAFNEGEKNILIGQVQVLAYGHTLPGSEVCPCDSIIFYETDFSLTNRTQCESRPELYGRNLPISIYDLYSTEMDKRILKSIIAKEDASLALLNYARTKGIRPEGFKIEELVV